MIKTSLIFTLWTFFLLIGSYYTQAVAQNLYPDSVYHKDSKGIIYHHKDVDVMAHFPGGEQKMFEWLGQNIVYPEDAKKAKKQGRVFSSFVVEKDGSIADLKILKKLSPSCDNEVIRVIKLFPKWIPATKGGEKVRVQFNLPVKFTLEEEKGLTIPIKK